VEKERVWAGLGWAGRGGAVHVADVGKRKTHIGFWWVHLKERDYLVDLGRGERIRTRGLHSSVSTKGQVESSCKHGNASSLSKKRLKGRIIR